MSFRLGFGLSVDYTIILGYCTLSLYMVRSQQIRMAIVYTFKIYTLNLSIRYLNGRATQLYHGHSQLFPFMSPIIINQDLIL